MLSTSNRAGENNIAIFGSFVLSDDATIWIVSVPCPWVSKGCSVRNYARGATHRDLPAAPVIKAGGRMLIVE